MPTIRLIASGAAVLLVALALGHGGRAADPKTDALKERQTLWADALKADGYKSEVYQRGTLKVVTGGRAYFVHLSEKDARFFAINSATTPPAGADRKAAAIAGNRVATENPGIKFYLNKDFYVLETSGYLATPESVKTVLPQALVDLHDARKQFEAVAYKAPAPPAKVAAPPTAAEEAKALDGQWRVEKLTRDGEVDGVVGGLVRYDVTIDADGAKPTWALKRGQRTTNYTVVLDPSQTPKAIDLVTPDGKEVTRGVYTLDGKTLTVAFAAPGADRPKKVESVKGSKVELWVLTK